MKSTAFILSLIVLFLSLKPGISTTMVFQSTSTEATTCCGSSCSPLTKNNADSKVERDTKKGDCKGNSCNPFQACCSCFLFYITESSSFEVKQKIYISTKQFFNYTSLFSSQYTTDVWQPPRFV